MGVEGRTILIAGGTSASGHALAEVLLSAGATVVSVGSDAVRLTALAEELPGIRTELTDLTDEAAVSDLAQRVHSVSGPIDGLVNLVGGWRGGGGLAGQSDDDYRVLERSFTALRHTSRAFYDDLVASSAGRLVIISSTAVADPKPGGANYAAVKAASETWTRAVAAGFAKGGTAGASIYRVTALAGMERAIAASILNLWDRPAAEVNGKDWVFGPS